MSALGRKAWPQALNGNVVPWGVGEWGREGRGGGGEGGGGEGEGGEGGRKRRTGQKERDGKEIDERNRHAADHIYNTDM